MGIGGRYVSSWAGAAMLLWAFGAAVLAPAGLSAGGQEAAASDPGAEGWITLIIKSPAAFLPPPPASGEAAREELDRVVGIQSALTPEEEERVRFWDEGAVTRRWTELLLEGTAAGNLNPPRAARAAALLHAAMHDATVAAWYAKSRYGRRSPAQESGRVRALVPAPAIPSYPGEHAAAAGAAAAVLGYLFPAERQAFARLAREAALSRVHAGHSFPSDAEAGLDLGARVGRSAVKRGRNDRSGLRFNGAVPSGPGLWAPRAPGALVEPLSGAWRTWVLEDGGEVKVPPPPAPESAERRAEIEALIEAAANLTEGQKAIARFWEDGPGTPTAAGRWVKTTSDLAGQRFHHDAPRAARALALVSIAAADAVISAWNLKHAHWTARPERVIGDFVPLLATPPHPGYPAGRAAIAGAAAEVLAALFPEMAPDLRARAEEAAVSGVYAGTCFPGDTRAGLALGRRVGALVAAHAAGGVGR